MFVPPGYRPLDGGTGFEAYLKDTSQLQTSEDAGKGGHIHGRGK